MTLTYPEHPGTFAYAARHADFAFRRIGVDWVVYHRPSGQTHFLNDAAATLLLWLTEEPRTLAEIQTRLAAEADSDMPSLGPLMSRLQTLGLVSEHGEHR